MVVPFKIVAEYESKRNVSDHGKWSLSPNEEFFFYTYGWGVAFAEFRLYKVEVPSLKETSRSAQIYDIARGFAWDSSKGLLACSTFKKLFIFDSRNLTLIHKITGIGNCLDELTFDRSSKYLVIGSYFNPMIKFIDPSKGELAYRKKLGYITNVCEGVEDNEILLGYGPSGSIRCFDCLTQKVKYEMACPPFMDAIRLGNELILGIGLPLPSYYISADLVNNIEIKRSLNYHKSPQTR
jgi:WD40 repeat protein